MRKLLLFSFAVMVFAGGMISLSAGAMVPAKAWLSVHLIDLAWMRTKAGESEARPWPWMDSYPVAKLRVPALDKEQVILKGVSGEVMAFSPGWHDGTERLGKPGISVISGHKDTHFSYLKKLKVGDKLELENEAGVVTSYRVEDLRVVQDPEIKVSGYDKGNVLLLTTCYPFSNWQVGGEMRYVVVAKQEDIVWPSI